MARRRGPKAPPGTPGGRAARVVLRQAGQAGRWGAVLDDVGPDLGQPGDLVGTGRRAGAGQGGTAGAGRRDALDDLSELPRRGHRPDGPLLSGLAAPLAPGGWSWWLAFDVWWFARRRPGGGDLGPQRLELAARGDPTRTRVGAVIAIRKLTREDPRFGYRRIKVLAPREAWSVNLERVHRRWRR